MHRRLLRSFCSSLVWALPIWMALGTGCASRPPWDTTDVCPACGAPRAAGEPYFDCYTSAHGFHHNGLHQYDECYLVRVEAIEVTGEMKNRHRLVSTILEPVKGRRAAGSRLDVMRVNDGRPYEFDRYLSWMTGKTIYVFLFTTADGGYEANEQDPSAVAHPSAEIRKVIRLHNKRCVKNVSQQ